MRGYLCLIFIFIRVSIKAQQSQLQISKLFLIILRMSNTPCAYHNGEIITHFCRCLRCLLPLCPQCIPLHQKEHKDLPEACLLIGIQESVDQVGFSISKQFTNLDIFTNETVVHFRKNDELHRKVLQDISIHKDKLFECLNSIYENLYLEVQSNNRRRQAWIQEFVHSAQEIKEEFSSLLQSLRKEKYLRTVIMWNRLNPEETMLNIIEKAKKQWLLPSFTGWDVQNFASNFVGKLDIKLLEIEGDTGSSKMLKLLRVLRYGQQTANELTSSQVSVQNMSSQYPHQQLQAQTKNLPLPSVPTSPSMRKSSHKKIAVMSTLEKL